MNSLSGGAELSIHSNIRRSVRVYALMLGMVGTEGAAGGGDGGFLGGFIFPVKTAFTSSLVRVSKCSRASAKVLCCLEWLERTLRVRARDSLRSWSTSLSITSRVFWLRLLSRRSVTTRGPSLEDSPKRTTMF